MTGRLRVLQSFPGAGRKTNPYLTQLADALTTNADVHGFSWKMALTGRYDVLHLHWPEVALRGATRPRTWLRHALFRMLLARLRRRRIGLVRTLHNPRPHEPGASAEQRLLRRCDAQTDVWIRLNPFTVVPAPDAPAHTIVHADYGPWARGRFVPAEVPGRLLCFGRIRPYKGVERLLAEFGRMPGDDISLRVAGEPLGAALTDRVRTLAAADARIGVLLGHIDDDTLAREVGQAQLVVLPYTDMHNSGALLLALTLARPALVPANPVTRWLRDEVGAGWVQTYEGDLVAETLAGALRRAQHEPPRHPPDLSARRWDDSARAHLAAYREAVDKAAGRAPAGRPGRAPREGARPC